MIDSLSDARLPKRGQYYTIHGTSMKKQERDNTLVLHYQGTTNTLEGPRKRSCKPDNPSTHKNHVASSTADEHSRESQNEEIDNSLKQLEHKSADSLVIASFGPRTCSLVAGQSCIDAFEDAVAMAGHVENIGDDKFGARAVGAHSERPTHLGDSYDENVKYQ